MTTRALDLTDIQGNIVRAYGHYGFPKARYFLLHVHEARAGRAFVEQIRQRVTTSERWAPGAGLPGLPRPKVTLNIGFSFFGLLALELPTRTLAKMPPEFIDGMSRRAHILGDVGPSGIDRWDEVWRESDTEPDRKVHIWISMNAQADPDGRPVAELEDRTRWLLDLVQHSGGGISLLPGHGPGRAPYQDASALMVRLGDGTVVPTGKEHFGFSDGIGDPVFEGQFDPAEEGKVVVGRGKLMADQSWKPLATGEFLLGHVDESQQLPPAAMPTLFKRNGTFMVYRKLHQNVGSFHGYIDRSAELYRRVVGVSSSDEARETIKAKMVGRWSDGIPLMAAPTWRDWQAFRASWADIPALRAKPGPRSAEDRARLDEYARMLIDFKYREDQKGIKCPLGAHIRRANPRDMLDPTIESSDPKDWNGSVLNNRRRVLRRGLPYGESSPDAPTDDGEHGIVLMAVCADLFRQFEFIQQQWFQYGLDFNVGNDTCPILGNREGDAKFVIPAAPESGDPPFICAGIPQFVTVRGGEYFFIPSMTALRMIAMGIVDPT